ncbi:MAG: nicotinamide mononucleotide transporter [Candidatus Peribacteraceae bacterium]|jgi:nicotinamide riboside transporter PnuC
MWDIIAQISISIFGAISVFLVARNNRWGWVMGLAMQPFWLITSYQHEQWGVFFVSFLYLGTWAYGTYRWFFLKKEPSR